MGRLKNIYIYKAKVKLQKALDHFMSSTTREKGAVRCWQYMECSHQYDKKCPIFENQASRKCWLVAGSLNGGKPFSQNIREKIIDSCKECEFYNKIKSGAI